MTPTPFGSTGPNPRFSCILSPPHNTPSVLTYTERVVVQSLTTQGFTLTAPGMTTSQTDGLIQDLPSDDSSVGVYKCSSTSTSTGTTTSVDVSVLSANRYFQPTDGRLTKTLYPGDDLTLSVTKMDSYTGDDDQIRWSTFSNLAEGSLSPDGDGSLTFTIRSASGKDANVYGTFQDGTVENLLYSMIRVIVAECPRGRWNVPACDRLCDNCYNGGICHPQSGTCICPPGFMGRNCLTPCSDNNFGWECELQCGPGNILESCGGSQICLPDPYGCNCLHGYTGVYCDEECPRGRFGVDCLQVCHCADGISCDTSTGRCDGECENGWSGEGCQVPTLCPDGYFGINCTDICNCPDHLACEKETGFCTSSGGQCEIGYVADSLETPDRCEIFSGCFESCSKTCHCAGGVNDCNHETGMCSSGSCRPRWMGDLCQTDRFEITSEKTNPSISSFTCTIISDRIEAFPADYVKAAIGDFSPGNWHTALNTVTSVVQSSLFSSFIFLVNLTNVKPIYCFIGSPLDNTNFAYVRLPPPETFVLPVVNNPPRLAALGNNYVTIFWDSWNANVDEGEGPVIGYRVYVTTPDGNQTHTSPLLSSVGQLDTMSSRKKRQGDGGVQMYNVTGLAEGETYEIRIAAVREGLNGEGEKGPALSVTKMKPPETKTFPIGAVGGGIGGGVLVLLSLFVVLFILRKRKRKHTDEDHPKEINDPEYEYVTDIPAGLKHPAPSSQPSNDNNEHNYQELETNSNAIPNYMTLAVGDSVQGIELSSILQTDNDDKIAYQNIGYRPNTTK